jgi:S-adenosylmethionine decarboxylase
MTEAIVPGKHLLIDFWHARALDQAQIEAVMRRAAEACGATVLNVLLHSFGEGGGITGVAILAESHISIHTWPELDYVALDVFVCGRCDPYSALKILRMEFQPQSHHVRDISRGADKHAPQTK